MTSIFLLIRLTMELLHLLLQEINIMNWDCEIIMNCSKSHGFNAKFAEGLNKHIYDT